MRPNGENAVIKALKKHNTHDFIIKRITLLSTSAALKFERNDNELIIKANENFNNSSPICFKIEID